MSRTSIADYLTDFGDDRTATFFDLDAPMADEPVAASLDVADIQAQCEDMYARGIVEGRRLAEEDFESERANFEAAVAEARAASAEELSALLRQEGESDRALGARVGTQIVDSLEEVRTQIADSVAELLKPFLLDAIANRSVAALLDALERLTRDPECPAVEVQGPQALVDAIAARLQSREVAVQASPGPETDVRVRVGRSVIDMRLTEWAAALEPGEASRT